MNFGNFIFENFEKEKCRELFFCELFCIFLWEKLFFLFVNWLVSCIIWEFKLVINVWIFLYVFLVLDFNCMCWVWWVFNLAYNFFCCWSWWDKNLDYDFCIVLMNFFVFLSFEFFIFIKARCWKFSIEFYFMSLIMEE